MIPPKENFFPDIKEGVAKKFDINDLKQEKSPVPSNREQLRSFQDKDKEMMTIARKYGPSNKTLHSLVNNLKIQDKNYDRMQADAEEIKKLDNATGNAKARTMLAANAKYMAEDKIERMKEQQAKPIPAQTEREKLLQTKRVTYDIYDPEQRFLQKFNKAEEEMRHQKALIEGILDQYSSSKKTVAQANKALLNYDINRWAQRNATSKQEDGQPPKKGRSVVT